MTGDKEIIHVFDFDGTLTRKDSFIELIRTKAGTFGLFLGILCYSPWLVMMKLGLYSNEKAKQRVFSHFFKNMSVSDFSALCQELASRREEILNQDVLIKLEEALGHDQQVFIVTASAAEWVQPFLPVHERLTIVATGLEVENGRLTGHFSTSNCYGAEKVRRLKKLLPLSREHYYIVAYGDSRGDKEMFEFAEEKVIVKS